MPPEILANNQQRLREQRRREEEYAAYLASQRQGQSQSQAASGYTATPGWGEHDNHINLLLLLG